MSEEDAFSQAVSAICGRDQRYDADAYFFLKEAMAKTVEQVTKAEGKQRHLTGQELSLGLRDHALGEFGPMAMAVMTSWGIAKTEDFGNMVYHLIDAGVFTKTGNDAHNDFAGVFDFTEAFVLPYLPESLKPVSRKEENAP
ncbi:MAG: hypothetical protein FWF84_07880 [Kiritimatiellaeota bacterium]|nr:hypothetical protein [Kiritimatiellota bacterium]